MPTVFGKPRITVLGSMNMDLVVKVQNAPRPGETVRSEDFKMVPGGKGANQAVGAARLGAEVHMVGRVGQDIFGETLIQNLKAAGVDAGHVRKDPEAGSGLALITVDATGQNSIVVALGANNRVSPEDVDSARDLIGASDALLMQLEIPIETVLYATRIAADKGVPVILNPAPARPAPDELLKGAAFLIPNESEASLLSGVVVSGRDEAMEAARRLLERGARNVIITLGDKGALVANPGASEFIAAYKVDALDTTAAGDTFIGAFVVAYLRGSQVIEAARYASAAASISVTRLGAQASMPTADEVEAFLERVR
ncbi:MAG TPA: ribokinase [Firmicutes bacterium]|nr:ribokinase [Bacillota bacterium]